MGLEGSVTGAKPFFQYTLVSPKCDQEATQQTITTQKQKDQQNISYSRDEVSVRGRKKKEEVRFRFLTLLERRETRPPQRAQNLVWQ